MLTQDQIQQFFTNGYLKLSAFASSFELNAIKQEATRQLKDRIQPLELESELQYPGAPSTSGNGSQTIRRLLQAYDRHSIFAQWATKPELAQALSQLMDEPVLLVRAHHNCVMTKQPEFSSDSWWHQDLRYWRYTKGNLISCWLALGSEHSKNGGLQLIPRSHKMEFGTHQFDDAKFFKNDLDENQAILKNKVELTLNPGDCLLFHSRLLHAATRNYTQETKLAAVFTYRGKSDLPIEKTRSSALEDIMLRSK